MKEDIPVDVTVYLPDDVGERAKNEGINLSRTLRDALHDELARRDAMSSALKDTQTHELQLEDKEGNPFTGRIAGTVLAEDVRHDVTVFLTDDERVIVYDERRSQHQIIDDPEDDLRGWLSDGAYTEAMNALGIKAIVDL